MQESLKEKLARIALQCRELSGNLQAVYKSPDLSDEVKVLMDAADNCLDLINENLTADYLRP